MKCGLVVSAEQTGRKVTQRNALSSFGSSVTNYLKAFSWDFISS